MTQKLILPRPIAFAYLLLCGMGRTGEVTNQLPLTAGEALNNAETVTLYALEPDHDKAPDATLLEEDYAIVHTTALHGEPARKAIRAVRAAVLQYEGWQANCFEPRFALELQSHEHLYAFVLSTACNRLALYEDGRFRATVGIYGSQRPFRLLLGTPGVLSADGERACLAQLYGSECRVSTAGTGTNGVCVPAANEAPLRCVAPAAETTADPSRP